MKKLEEEKVELITGVNEVTEEAQSENIEVEKRLIEMTKCKDVLESQLIELENILRGKDEEIVKLTETGKLSRHSLETEVAKLDHMLQDKDAKIGKLTVEIQSLHGKKYNILFIIF